MNMSQQYNSFIQSCIVFDLQLNFFVEIDCRPFVPSHCPFWRAVTGSLRNSTMLTTPGTSEWNKIT